MEIVYFTLVAAGLYFFSDWLLDRIEKQRGKRFEQRSIIFFVIIMTLALLSFELISYLQPPEQTGIVTPGAVSPATPDVPVPPAR